MPGSPKYCLYKNTGELVPGAQIIRQVGCGDQWGGTKDRIEALSVKNTQTKGAVTTASKKRQVPERNFSTKRRWRRDS
jgi:hypothetical protein